MTAGMQFNDKTTIGKTRGRYRHARVPYQRTKPSRDLPLTNQTHAEELKEAEGHTQWGVGYLPGIDPIGLEPRNFDI